MPFVWSSPAQSSEVCLSPGAYDSIRSSYSRSQDAERLANESAVTKSSIVVQSGRTRHRTEQLLTAKKDDFSRKNAANKRALGDLSGRLQGLDLKKVNEKVGPPFGPGSCPLKDRLRRNVQKQEPGNSSWPNISELLSFGGGGAQGRSDDLTGDLTDLLHGRRFVAPPMMLPVGRARVGVQGAVMMMGTLTVEA